MRIFLLASSLEQGGAERQLAALANGLFRKGHDVHVVLFNGRGPLVADLDVGIDIVDLDKGGMLDLPRVALRVANLCRALRPRVVYSFLGVPNLVNLAAGSLCRRVKVVWSVRASDMDLQQYGMASRACYRLEIALSGMPDMIISNSQAGLEHAVGNGMPGHLMQVVPNGIDMSRFYPDPESGREVRAGWRQPPGSLLVGMVARIDVMKDHENLLQAARLVLEGEADVRFVCIGDGDTALLEHLKAEARRLGVSDAFHWAGKRTDMNAVYNSLDICCLPSAFGEGFPNVVGEAMSCGVPCAVTDVGDSGLVVGRAGVVVPRKKPEALASGILNLIRSLREGGLASPREQVRTNYSMERMVERTERLLMSLVKSG